MATGVYRTFTVECMEFVKSARKNILESILDQRRTVRILFRTGRPSVDVETVGNDLFEFLDAANLSPGASR